MCSSNTTTHRTHALGTCSSTTVIMQKPTPVQELPQTLPDELVLSVSLEYTKEDLRELVDQTIDGGEGEELVGADLLGEFDEGELDELFSEDWFRNGITELVFKAGSSPTPSSSKARTSSMASANLVEDIIDADRTATATEPPATGRSSGVEEIPEHPMAQDDVLS